MKLIAICDGHGMETSGKRTPEFPAGSGMHSETGNFMHENEFNREVAALLNVHLQRCGFRTLMVAPTDADTPLKARTDAANAAKADLYISIHANAMGAGGWNSTRGIETFHYTQGSEASKKAAAIIHRNLLSGTKLPDRGVKAADFHVLRETHMPAVLVECGFMTNQDDARLLLSDAYRAECAEELARGLCEFFGTPFVRTDSPSPNTPPPADKPLPDIQRTVSGRLNGAAVPIDSYLIEGKAYVPLRWLVESMGANIKWDPTKYEYDLTVKGK